eukprot:316550_1
MSQAMQQDNDEEVDEKTDKKENNSVNLIELVSICYDLACQSGIKIAEILASGNLHVHDKHSPKDNMNTDAKNDEEKKEIKKHKIARPKLSRCETLLGSTSFEAKDPQTLEDIFFK